MEKRIEELLKKMTEKIQPTAEGYLKKRKFDNYVVSNIICYNKKIELANTTTKEKEEFKLYVVITENTKPEKGQNPIFEIEFLEDKNGNILTIEELIKEHKKEDFKSIKDVIDKTQKNEVLPEKKQDKEYTKEELNSIKREKKKEEEKRKEEENRKKKNEKSPRKPQYIIQTVDLDNAYSDNIETLHRAFRLPPNVKKLAYAYPNKEDRRQLGSGATIYMLDVHDNIVGDAKKYFRVDDATGKNPMYDDSTLIETTKTGERHTGKTMRRFRSTQRPDQYTALYQKEVGQYNKISADRKKETENASIGNQVETPNVEIQTSLEIQQINSTYKGVFLPDRIDKEVDKHEKHGDDMDKIKKENLDGLENTKAPCDKNIYLVYECLAELKQNKYISENYSDEEIVKTITDNIDKKQSTSKEQLIEKTKETLEEREQERVPWDSGRTRHG